VERAGVAASREERARGDHGEHEAEQRGAGDGRTEGQVSAIEAELARYLRGQAG
jgi:hypothetical protein